MIEIDESWYTKPEGIRESESAGGIVARKDGDKVLVALVMEGDFNDYVLPKGHLEQGENPEQAAVREIIEEAGISDLTLVKKLDTVGRLNSTKTEWKISHYFLFKTSQSESKPTDKKYGPCSWFDINELPKMFWPEQEKLIKANKAGIIEDFHNKNGHKSYG